jgi:hypothetical protein
LIALLEEIMNHNQVLQTPFRRFLVSRLCGALVTGIILSSASYAFAVADEDAKISQPAKQHKAEFVNIDPLANFGKLVDLQFSSSCAATQSAKNGGIKFQINIKNGGAQKISITNPLQNHYLYLMTADDHMLQLPRRNTGYGRPMVPGQKSPITYPFGIGSVILNGKSLTKEEFDARNIDILPSSEYQLNLIIEKASKTSPRHQRIVREVLPIPLGKYNIHMMVFARDSADVSRLRQVTSPILPVELAD